MIVTEMTLADRLRSLTKLDASSPALVNQIYYQSALLKAAIGSVDDRATRTRQAKEFALAYSGKLDSIADKRALEKLLTWFKDLVSVTCSKSQDLSFRNMVLPGIQETLVNLHDFLTLVRSALPRLFRGSFDKQFKYDYVSFSFEDRGDLVVQAKSLEQAYEQVVRTSSLSPQNLIAASEFGESRLYDSSLALWDFAIKQFRGIEDMIGAQPSTKLEAARRDNFCYQIMAQLASPHGSQEIKKGFEGFMKKVCQLAAACYGPALTQTKFDDVWQKRKFIIGTKSFFANLKDFLGRLTKVWQVKDSSGLALLDSYLDRKQNYPIYSFWGRLKFRELSYRQAIEALVKLT